MAKSKKPALPNIAIEQPIKYVKRKIEYHELHIEFKDNFRPKENEDKFAGFFSAIAKMAKAKEEIRYQPVLEAKIFMQDVIFNSRTKKIIGKLRYIRMDVFPELIDLDTDETEDIDSLENQGIVETTHFVIDYSKPIKKIAIEYNHVGAKISDFVTYCELIGDLKNAIKSVSYRVISKDELVKYKQRMGKCASMIVRIHKSNIEKIEGVDSKLFSALKATEEQFNAEYIELKLSFSYKKMVTQPVNSTLTNLLTRLISDKKKLSLFETLKVSAKDAENNYRMKLFDLLLDKVESELTVQRKPKHKVIVSSDIFEKMEEELRNKKL